VKTSERWCIINAEMNNKRIGVLASALVGCIFTLSAQDLTMKITKRYLNLPVSHQVDRALMTFMTVNITCSTNIIRMNATGGICIGGMQ